VQAHPNGGQILLAIDDICFPRRRLKRLMDGAHTHRDTQQVTDEFDDAATRAAAYQRQPDDHLAQPAPGDRQFEQHLVVRRRGPESIVQCDAGLVRLLVNELAAHPVPGRHIADRLRSRQDLNGQLFTVVLR
jgi:hypothetical protein